MRTRHLPLALLATTSLVLTACGGEGDDPALSGEPTPTTEATTTSATDAEGEGSPVTEPTPTGAGEQSAEVLAIDAEARTITVDHIEFLVGEEAKAEWAAQGGDPNDGPPNDYVIRDPEDVEVTYEIADDAVFTIVDLSDEVLEGVPASLEELIAAHEATPFTVRLLLDGDVVTEIHQRFTP